MWLQCPRGQQVPAGVYFANLLCHSVVRILFAKASNFIHGFRCWGRSCLLRNDGSLSRKRSTSRCFWMICMLRLCTQKTPKSS